MKQTKLITALSSLSKEEWNSFKKYILMESSKSSDHYKLFEILMKNKTRIESLPSKENFQQIYFPDMSTKSFLNLCSRVYQIFEDWLVWFETKKDKEKCGVLLVKTYNRRGLFDLADKKYRALNKNLQNDNKLSFTRKMYLSEMNYYHHFSENEAKTTIGGILLNDSVTNFYKSFKEQANLFLLETTYWGPHISFDYSDVIDVLLNATSKIPNTEESRLLELLHKSDAENTNSYLIEVYENLTNERIKRGSDLEVFLTLYSISICSRNWHTGKESDASLLIKFYEYGLHSGILLNLGKMTCLRFLNIISVLIHTQSSEECYEFIDRWIHLIEDEDLESAKSLSYIYPKLNDGQYEDILYLLRGKKYNTLLMNFRSVAFETIALYKTQEWDLLKNRLQNHKRKIRGAKNKISKSLYDSQMNFVNVMELLMKSHFNNIKSINLNSYKILFNRTWLQKEIKSRGLN